MYKNLNCKHQFQMDQLNRSVRSTHNPINLKSIHTETNIRLFEDTETSSKSIATNE